MNGALPKARLKQLVAASAPGVDAQTLDARLAAALKAARLPDKAVYRPEEVAAIGQALMRLAADDVATGLAALEALAAEEEPAD